MFKLSTHLTKVDENDIKNMNEFSFGYKAITKSNSSDYGLIYKDDKVVSSACISIPSKFIHNLCTHPKYRKQGHSKKLVNIILDKYRYIEPNKLLFMQTENNKEGIIPTKIYKNAGWLLEKEIHNNYRNSLFYFPITGLCKNNISINNNLNIINKLYNENNFIDFLEQLVYFILQDKIESKNYKYDSCKSFYHKLLLHKNSNNENKMYNHILYLQNNNNNKYLMKNTKYNFNNFNNFFLVFVKKENYLIINKINNIKEYYYNKKKNYFDKIISYYF